MEKSEKINKQSSSENELTESLEEIKFLLGLNSFKEIETIKKLLEENKNNLLKTIQLYMSYF